MAAHRLDRRAFVGASAGVAGGVGLAALGEPAAALAGAGGQPSDVLRAYRQWRRGPNPRGQAGYFPRAVWMQSPTNAGRYADIGINCFIGLWEGPTEDQLATLAKFGMRTICAQNKVGLAHRDDPTIVGWLQMDEPDNAQPKAGGGYGPPVPPTTIIERYHKMRHADPTRPVYLGLGAGVADLGWEGRGTSPPWDDYYDYVRGGDIDAFDFYPVASGNGPLWYPAKGVDRMHSWCDRYDKIVWNVIETTNISSDNYPTPAQVRSEVWMSIIHGSYGISYFCHKFKPEFDETGLLDEPKMREAVRALNAQLAQLAPVLNGQVPAAPVRVCTSRPDVPVDVLVRRHRGATYVFAACMRDHGVTASFHVGQAVGSGHARVRVIGEDRQLSMRKSRFRDEFAPYGVHLYEIRA